MDATTLMKLFIKKYNKVLFLLAAVLSWLIPAAMLLFPILTGNIPFWYDPARDMLSAWDNLHKLTLIGPTSGIPGIFYGPYWIWFLSIPIFFSKDPRLTTLVVSFLPYFVIFPIILWQFRRIVGKWTILMLWLLFIFTYQSYAIFLWNPNNAPILFLLAIDLFISLDQKASVFHRVLRLCVAGLVVGLALNIDISFGTVFTLGSLIYLVLSTILLHERFFEKLQKVALHIGSFLLGIIVMFAPFFLFEFRHGFQQTKTALHAFSRGGDVVTVHGMTKPEILQNFFVVLATLLHMPLWVAGILLFVSLIALTVGVFRGWLSFKRVEGQLLLILLSVSLACLGLYLSVRNPVWGYHFIGVEIIWLLFTGLMLKKLPFVKYLFSLWVIVVVTLGIYQFIPSLHISALLSESLAAKKYAVTTIMKDAGEKEYAVYAYSPSIYIYEYSYLFRWLAQKDVPYDPGMEHRTSTVYLILPAANNSKLSDFINYRTPGNVYKTTETIHMLNGTVVLKRESNSKR